MVLTLVEFIFLVGRVKTLVIKKKTTTLWHPSCWSCNAMQISRNQGHFDSTSVKRWNRAVLLFHDFLKTYYMADDINQIRYICLDLFVIGVRKAIFDLPLATIPNWKYLTGKNWYICPLSPMLVVRTCVYHSYKCEYPVWETFWCTKSNEINRPRCFGWI